MADGLNPARDNHCLFLRQGLSSQLKVNTRFGWVGGSAYNPGFKSSRAFRGQARAVQVQDRRLCWRL